MQCDLLIENGTVVDPVRGIHAVQDIAVAAGVIVELASDEKVAPAKRLNARGLLVTPGLIDLHVHVYRRHVPISLDADEVSLASGVTTMLDAGSAGSYNFAGFRYDVIDRVDAQVFGLVNLSCIGLVAAHYGELMDPRYADPAGVVRVIEQFPEVALGVKIRAGAQIIGAGQQGWDNFLKAVQAARDSGTWLMIHIGESPMPVPEMIPHLQAGDCITHCFKGGSETILDEDGKVFEAVAEGARHGIVFDVGHGLGSFHWDIVQAALDQGFEPTTISTDLYRDNVHGPVYDLPTTMSKFLMLGVSLDRVIAMSTSEPARVLGRNDDLGTLRPGTVADITLLDMRQGEFTFTDSYQQTRVGDRLLQAAGVVRRGELFVTGNRLQVTR